jgi:hypothetical protein
MKSHCLFHPLVVPTTICSTVCSNQLVYGSLLPPSALLDGLYMLDGACTQQGSSADQLDVTCLIRS